MYSVESRLYYENKENINNIANFKDVYDTDITKDDDMLKEYISTIQLEAVTLIKDKLTTLDIKMSICGSSKERIIYILLTSQETPIKLLKCEILESGKYKYTLSLNALFYINEAEIVNAILKDYTSRHTNPENKLYLCINIFQDTISTLPYCHVYTTFKHDNRIPYIRKKIQECPFRYVLIEISMFGAGKFYTLHKNKWKKGTHFKIEDLSPYFS